MNLKVLKKYEMCQRVLVRRDPASESDESLILYKNYESKISNIGTRTQTTMQKADNKKKRTILCFKMRFSNHKKVF